MRDSHKVFVHELAHFLVANQALMSVSLEMGNQSAREWSRLRIATPLRGYPTVKEAEEQLAKWLFDGE